MTASKTAVTAVEGWVQIGLTLAVGAVAACASWSHVLDLARQHGQAGWIAWAVAACVETATVSAGLEVRRRRRTGMSAVLPAGVLVVATALQLSAQVAQAERSPWGVLLAAVPAVTFLVLVKLALARASHPVMPAEATPVMVETPVMPAGVPANLAGNVDEETPEEPESQPEPPLARELVDVSDLLLPGRAVARELERSGQRVTRKALQEGLRARGHKVSTERAQALLGAVRDAPGPPQRVAG